jgi:multidrug efflux pump subunit AcrB
MADAAIAWRWLVAGLALGALIATVWALAGGVVQREAMPEIDGDVLEARMLMPTGTPLARTEEAVAQVDEALGGAPSLILTEPGIRPQGVAEELSLGHPDLAVLEAVVRATQAELECQAGARNAVTDLRTGWPELRLATGAQALGLTAADAAGQSRAGFPGTQLADACESRIAREVELVLASADRAGLADLAEFSLALPGGGTAPLARGAPWEEARGWAAITHRDGARVVTVQADVDARLGNADAINARSAAGFLPVLEAATPGLAREIAVHTPGSAETVGSILRGFGIGLVGIRIVMPFRFRSNLEPAIVMVSIPLVLVIRERAAAGMGTAEAAGEAVRARLRPILVSVSTALIGIAAAGRRFDPGADAEAAGHRGGLPRNIPVKRARLADGSEALVATVLDLLVANCGLDRGPRWRQRRARPHRRHPRAPRRTCRAAHAPVETPWATPT